MQKKRDECKRALLCSNACLELRSYSGREGDNDNDIRNAYGAPITTPSSPLVMPESPLMMHHDAQNGQCKLYTIYTVINA